MSLSFARLRGKGCLRTLLDKWRLLSGRRSKVLLVLGRRSWVSGDVRKPSGAVLEAALIAAGSQASEIALLRVGG